MNNFISKYAISLSSIVKKCNNSQLNLVVMHGLLGSKKNFRSFSNHEKICGNVKETHLLDLRNHGESPHTDNMSLRDMALDLQEYIQNLDNVILLGHSLGGRVIFQYLHDQMQNDKIKGIIIVDILPTKVESTFVSDLLQQLIKIQLKDRTFQELENEITQATQNQNISLLILSNIGSKEPITRRDTKNNYYWKINLDSIVSNLKRNIETDLIGEWKGPSLVICGEHSQYVRPNQYQLYQKVFPKLTNIEIIKDAGHWVHAEKQKDFIDCVSKFLINLKQ